MSKADTAAAMDVVAAFLKLGKAERGIAGRYLGTLISPESMLGGLDRLEPADLGRIERKARQLAANVEPSESLSKAIYRLIASGPQAGLTRLQIGRALYRLHSRAEIDVALARDVRLGIYICEKHLTGKRGRPVHIYRLRWADPDYTPQDAPESSLDLVK